MSNPLRHPEYYEHFIYTLSIQFPEIQRSTLALIRRSNYHAIISGTIFFGSSIRLTVFERIEYSGLPARMVWYGYEVWQGNKKLYWYDPQPRPNNPDLQSTHPHHKHIPPNIKRNRIPAPDLRFDRPNLPFLIITEIGSLLASSKE